MRTTKKPRISRPRNDPGTRQGKPKFSGGKNSKTMKIDSPKLPNPPADHPHKSRTFKKPKRAK